MTPQKRQNRIANCIMNCPHCQPLSGCLLSGLRGTTRQETASKVRNLSDIELAHLLDFHESCPYQHKLSL